METVNIEEKLKTSKPLAIAAVFVIFLLDNMFRTAVVPLVPKILHEASLQTVQTTNTSNSDQKNSSLCRNNSSTYKNVSCLPQFKRQTIPEKAMEIGILLASKTLVQAPTNFIVGPVVDRIGYGLPVLLGCVIMLASSCGFAFGMSYAVFLAARAVHGVGSSCIHVAGAALLADRYRGEGEEKRGKAIGIALGGVGVGVLIGPSFASIVYQVAGKEAVFLFFAGAAFVAAGTILFINGVSIQKIDEKQAPNPASMLKLLCDPYIVLAAMALLIGNLGVGVISTAQPLWMVKTMKAQTWQLGVAFLPLNFSFLVAVSVSSMLCQKTPKWFVAFLGTLLIASGCIGTPFAKNFWELIPPGVIHGSGLALLETSIFPMMAFLVEERHNREYGSVYALCEVSFNLSFVFGALYTGAVMGIIGFEWVTWSFGIFAVAFAPFLLFLKKPDNRKEDIIPLVENINNQSGNTANTSNSDLEMNN